MCVIWLITIRHGDQSHQPRGLLLPPQSLQICLNWWRDDGKQKKREREESSCGSLWLQSSVISVPSSWCLNPQLGPRLSLSHTYTYMYRDMCTQKHREQAPDTWALWRSVFMWILAKEHVANKCKTTKSEIYTLSTQCCTERLHYGHV